MVNSTASCLHKYFIVKRKITKQVRVRGCLHREREKRLQRRVLCWVKLGPGNFKIPFNPLRVHGLVHLSHNSRALPQRRKSVGLETLEQDSTG